MAPNLETSRLQLRPCDLSDLPQVHALWTQQQIRQFLFDDRVISTEEAGSFIADSHSNFGQHGYGLWLVFVKEAPPKATNKPDWLIGFAGAIPAEAAPSLIYGIDPAFWGRGYATEAIRAVLNYLLTELACPKIIADVDEPNLASIRVLHKLGMTQIRRDIGNQPSLNQPPVNQHPLLYFELKQSPQSSLGF